MTLDGRVAIITGSGQGIGRAIALRFAREGASVVINYGHDPARASKVVEEIEAAGGKARSIRADVSHVQDITQLIRELIDRFGRLDVLVNNAGIERKAAFWDVTETEYDAVMAVNAKGVFFTSQATVKYWMETKRPGKIINISSVHEEYPFLPLLLIAPARARFA